MGCGVVSMFLTTCPITANRSADCSTQRDSEQRNCGRRSLFSYVERSADEWMQNELRRWRCPASDDIGLHNSVRYSGACPWRHLNTMTAVLKVTRCRTGSQCRTSAQWITDEQTVKERHSSDNLARLRRAPDKMNSVLAGLSCSRQRSMSLRGQQHMMRDELGQMELLLLDNDRIGLGIIC